MQFLRVGLLFTLIITAFSSHSSLAQPSDACPAIVDVALDRIDDHCSAMERNSVCYGHHAIIADFLETMPDGFFDAPSDQAELEMVQRLQTSGLSRADDAWGVAVLNVQANLPDTLPGQGVLFLLMGEASLDNRITSRSAPPAEMPVDVVPAAVSSLYARPTGHAAIISHTQKDIPVLADALNADGSWVRVHHADHPPLWVRRSALYPDEVLNTLPRVDPLSLSAMQSFRFRGGIGAAACEETSGTLVIQGPQGILVDLEANGATVTIGSTIALRYPAENVLELITLSGTAYVDGVTVPAGYAVSSAVNAEGQVAGGWSAPCTLDDVSRRGLAFVNRIPAGMLHYPLAALEDIGPDCLSPQPPVPTRQINPQPIPPETRGAPPGALGSPDGQPPPPEIIQPPPDGGQPLPPAPPPPADDDDCDDDDEDDDCGDDDDDD